MRSQRAHFVGTRCEANDPRQARRDQTNKKGVVFATPFLTSLLSFLRQGAVWFLASMNSESFWLLSRHTDTGLVIDQAEAALLRQREKGRN